MIANPTSTRQHIAALVQIPKGSLPLASARQTHTLDVLLEPYGTHGHEYSFYFPSPGTYTHFPVHVTRGGAIVAAAPGRVLEVTASATVNDPHSWAHISQRGTTAEVVTYLGERNIGIFSTDLDSFDFTMRTADRVIAAVTKKLEKHGKGIVLMHDFQKHTAEALPELLKQLQAGGYKIVHMTAKGSLASLPEYDEMLQKQAKLPTLSTRPTSSVVRTIGE